MNVAWRQPHHALTGAVLRRRSAATAGCRAPGASRPSARGRAAAGSGHWRRERRQPGPVTGFRVSPVPRAPYRRRRSRSAARRRPGLQVLAQIAYSRAESVEHRSVAGDPVAGKRLHRQAEPGGSLPHVRILSFPGHFRLPSFRVWPKKNVCFSVSYDSSGEELNGGDEEPGLRCSDHCLEVFRQSPVSV